MWKLHDDMIFLSMCDVIAFGAASFVPANKTLMPGMVKKAYTNTLERNTGSTTKGG